MTEQEKRDFEKHKNAAETQLHQLYYGKPKAKPNSSSLSMPDFLSKPRSAPTKPKEPVPQNPPSSPPQPKPSPPARTNGMNLLNLINIKGMQMDNDRLIVLVLCLLLSSEEADELLLLALLYIML